MRYLIYVLIIANLVFFAWYPRPLDREADEARLRPLPPDVDTLVLLSERDRRQADDLQADAVSAPARPGPAAETGLAGAGQPGQPDVVSKEEEPPPPALICQTVGPFRDQANAHRVEKQLRQQGYIPRLREGKVREQAGYWVYLPAMPRKRAREIVADLDAHGMKDYYIGKQNFISLGIFTSRSKAEDRRRRVAQLGYDAVLDPRYRNRKVYWLDMEASRESLAGRPLWQKLSENYPKIVVQGISCE